jgi:methionyl-tRNA formyltransferase
VIERRVRAFDPFPGAMFAWGGEVIKLWRAAVLAPLPGQSASPPGTVVDLGRGRLGVACGEGSALELLEVQRPGGRRLAVSAWLQAAAAQAPLPGASFAVPAAPVSAQSL